MADSPPASSTAAQQAMAELLSEITFQKVLLSSIDDSVGNRESAEREVRQEIKALESQLRSLRRGTTMASNSSAPQSSQPAAPKSTSSDSSSAGTFVGHHQYQDGERSQGADGSTSSTPTSVGSSSTNMTCPRFIDPGRKRSHTSVHDGGSSPGRVTKSRRTSPNDGFTTSSPISSGDEALASFDRESLQLQKAEEERIARERSDAEFARSIQDAPQAPPAMVQQTSSGLSAFDRISGVRPSASANPGPHSMTSSINIAQSSSRGQGGETKYITGGNDIRAIPGTFIEDLSSDSDIEIITPSEFRDNSRRQATGGSTLPRTPPVARTGSQNNKRHSFSSTSSSPTNDALRLAMYGKQSVPKWMIEAEQNRLSKPKPSVGFSSANAGMGMYGTGAGQSVYPYNFPGNGSITAQSGSAFLPANHGLSGHNSLPSNGLNYLANNGYGSSFSDVIDMTSGHNFDLSAYSGRRFDEGMAEQYDYIVNDPRKTNAEIKELLENIQPDMDIAAENREGTPEGLKYPLYEHQKVALTWLKSMEDGSNKGGILADDMGLGKTISALALILSRPADDRIRKTTLIVGPVALVRQWEREIRMKIKVSHRLSTHMIHGQTKRLDWDQLRNFDIVLTTYGTLGAEFRRLRAYMEKHKDDKEMDHSPMRKLFPTLGPKSLWYRVILDEAQCIKNKNTIGAQAACHLRSQFRFCLTGTPMMNNVGELYSLIHFLRIKPYNAWPRFSEDFGLLSKGTASKRETQNAMRKLQAVIKAILLRRTKTTKLDGKPIIELPKKTEEIQHVVFSEDEQEFYNALETKTRIQFNKYMKANTVGKNYSNILVLLLRLRQCCCHPHLITDFEEVAPAGVQQSPEVMVELAKSLTPDVVGRLLAAEGFECPVCYDGVENPSIVIPCGHDTCAECLSKISDQAVQQNVAAGNESGATSKCPTCRGKVDLNKIIDYATFKQVHMPGAYIKGDESPGDLGDDSDDDSSDADSDSDSGDDANSDGDLRDFIVPDNVDEESEADEDPIKDDDNTGETEALPKELKLKGKGKKEKRRSKNKDKKAKGKGKEKQHLSLAMLKKGASHSAAGRRRYTRYLRRNWQPSAKVTKCVELLDQFQREGQKTIVFSQFVSLLDLLHVPIEQNGWECERYDGSMSAEARNDAITRFTDKPSCKMMLISLKAGNSGLNLVAASRVIILDPFWNPFIEMQAVDRAYRIGQQREVQVHRILIKSTVEDRIIELQNRKRELVNAALDEGANKSLGRLDAQQLAFLFGVGAQ